MMAGHEIGKREYYVVFVVLMVLLVATVIMAKIHLGAFNLVVALTIAVVKALLVVLYFMHARTSDRLVWVFICAGVIWVILLIGGTIQDVLTRGWFI